MADDGLDGVLEDTSDCDPPLLSLAKVRQAASLL